MSGDEQLREWVGQMSQKFPAARSPGLEADEDDASARANPAGRELIAEGRTIYEQCQEQYGDLQLAGLPANELRDFRDRLNSVYGRLERMEGQAELRRAITDLRNLLRDLQDRNRQIPAGGLDGPVDIVGDIELREDFAASSDADSSTGALNEELQEIHGRITSLYEGLRDRIPDDEQQTFRQRNDALIDVLAANQTGNELRRAITDAHDLLNDLNMRQREVQAQGGSDREAPGGGPPAADGTALYEQAEARYDRLAELIPNETTELENYRRQVDSLWGRFNNGNPAERQRALVDLRGMVQDMDRRIREESRR